MIGAHAITMADSFVRLREGLRFRSNALSANVLRRLQRQGHRVRFVRVGENLYLNGEEYELEQLIDNPEIEDIYDVATETAFETGEVQEIEQFDIDEINTASDADFVDAFPSETTSLLPGAGVAAGGAAGTSAGTAGGGAILTGLVVAGGTIVVGTTLGATTLRKSEANQNNNNNNHRDPSVSLPDHRYIGPGNTVDDETEPVDQDDAIARSHDIAYEHAQSQADIHRADEAAVIDFANDFINTGNVHSAIGAVGLGTKRVIEQGTGVLYPPNLPISVAGMSHVSAWQTYMNALYDKHMKKTGRYTFRLAHNRTKRGLGTYDVRQDPRQNPRFPDREAMPPAVFRNRARYIWDAWNRARQNRGLNRVMPPDDLNIGVTFQPPVNADGTRPTNSAVPFNDWLAGRVPSSGNEPSPTPNIETPPLLQNLGLPDDDDISLPDMSSLPDFEDMDTGSPNLSLGGISPSDFDDRDGAGPSHANVPTHTQESSDDYISSSGEIESSMPATGGGGGKRQRTDAGPSASATPAMEAAGGGGTGASDGGFDSASGPDNKLFRGFYRVEGGQMVLSTVHTITQEAIPYTNVASALIAGGANMTVTPLGCINWDQFMFYMSEDCFNIIPAGSHAHSCSIDGIAMTFPAGYPVGGTTADVSTTNHAKILLGGYDLFRKSRGGKNVEVKTLNASMVPTAIDSSPDNVDQDFIDKQWGTDQTAEDAAIVLPGVAFDIPYRNRKFFAVYQPNKAQATSNGYTISNAHGFEYFRNMLTQVNANDFVWDADVFQALFGRKELSYKFVSAPIGEQFPQWEIDFQNFEQAVGSGENYNLIRTTANTKPGENLQISERVVPSTRNTYPIATYKGVIEKGATMVKGDSPNKPAYQPSVHIGLKAIEKFDPTNTASRASTFVQARMTYQIKATMRINLPTYPFRTTRPKSYYTSMEKAMAGIGYYMVSETGVNRPLITFGTPQVTQTAPTRDANDIPDDETGVPNRSLPRVPRAAPQPAKPAASASTPAAPGTARSSVTIN